MSVKSTRVWTFVQRHDKSTPESWKLEEKSLPALKENQVLIKTLLISCDPYLRIQQSTNKTWQDPYEEQTVQLSFCIGRVLESQSQLFKENDFVRCYAGWVEHAVLDDNQCTKLDVEKDNGIPLEAYLGPLGMVGETAFHGVNTVFEPIQKGEVALVTGAAGAVGTNVTQLLKKKGMFVIGIAGSDKKCELLKSKFGCDKALNYKTDSISADLLRSISPNGGIDVFFDNVGGEIFDAAIQCMNTHGRIAICGSISQYDHLDNVTTGPRFLHRLIYTRVKIQGILNRDMTKDQRAAHLALFKEMLRNGELQMETTIVDGFDNTPQAQCDMMNGANIGKQVVKVADW